MAVSANLSETLSLPQPTPWKSCNYCLNEIFKTSSEFTRYTQSPNLFIPYLIISLSRHLRDHHCSREGGSYVCLYGYNGVCTSLPVEGVSDKDYEDHVVKHHIKIMDFKDIGC